MGWLDFLVIFLVLTILFLVGNHTANKTNNQAAYLVANRNIGLFPLMATLIMTEFNATTFVSHAAAGYSTGLRALVLPGILFICLTFYAITVSKKWKEYNGESIAQFFALRYSKSLGIFSAFCFSFAMMGLTATYIKSFTILAQGLFPQCNPWKISALLVSLVALISIKGGLKAIVRIDICSFIGLLIFLPIMAYYSFTYEFHSVHPSSQNWQMPHQILSGEFLAAFILFACLSYLAAPWYGQKVLAAKSPQTSFKAALLAAFFVFLMYGTGVVCSKFLFDKGIILVDSQHALGFILANVLPHGVQGFGLAIIISISVTTIASAWNVMTALIIGNFRQSKLEGVKLDKLLTLFIGVLSFLITNILIDDVFSKMILVSIPLVSFSFSILGGFYWKQANYCGALTSILVGTCSGIATYLHYGDAGNWLYHWMTIGIPLIFITGIIFSYIKIPKTLASN